MVTTQTAKLFENGRSQAVRLPKEFRFDGNEVGISRLGKMVVLYAESDADDIFYSSLGRFDDDVFTAIEANRAEAEPSVERVAL